MDGGHVSGFCLTREPGRFAGRAYKTLGSPLKAGTVRTLQANIGYRCTMRCGHCHIEASPERTEMMDTPTCDALIRALESNPAIGTLDITGGAPELHPELRRLVTSGRRLGRHVIVRSNLDALTGPGMEGLPGFFASEGVEIAASFPHYDSTVFESVRGAGSYERCMRALRLLNDAGYGSAHTLSLVHNPAGAHLAPAEALMEAVYRSELGAGIAFSRVHVFANMPIGRFGRFLSQTGQRDAYQSKLEAAFSPNALDGVMCRSIVSVGPDGWLYDCDFNQALGLGVKSATPAHISGFDAAALSGREIAVGEHCFGCVAGEGFT